MFIQQSTQNGTGVAFATRVVAVCILVLALVDNTSADTGASLLVSSHDTDEVFRYDEVSGAFIDVMVSSGSGGLNAPHGLAFGPDRNLYVGSAGSDRILRYNGETGVFIDTFVTNGAGGLDYPAGIVFGPDGHLYVASQLSDEILRFHGLTGAFLGSFVTAGSGGLNGPSVPVFGPDTNLYVTGRFDNRVYKYNGTNGAFMQVFVTNMLSQPFGCDFGPDGNLYVSSGNLGNIRRFDGQTGAYIDDFVTTGLSFPVQFIFGPDTNIYACNYSSDAVTRYRGTNGASLGTFVASGNGLNGPNFLVFRPSGSGPLDRDADGMPDYWEIMYGAAGLSPTVSNAAGSDADGDFVSDLEEFIGDTSPADSNDYFRIHAFGTEFASVISFDVSTNRQYGMQYVDGLDSTNWITAIGGFSATYTGGVVTFSVPHNSGTQKAFRITVELP